jgi:Carboxypeptidase regulatory-like domain
MKKTMNRRLAFLRAARMSAVVLALILACQIAAHAQQIFGAITGTVRDASGSAVQDVTVTARNLATNLTVTAHSQSTGSYSISNLPAGTYQLTFTKQGFNVESHGEVLVNGDRTTTVDGNLKVGAVATKVDVIGTPLMNQVDATTGYVVDQSTIQQTPLGTGSFTQLAILSPGVHADFLGGAGANAGLGNQAIFANGQARYQQQFLVERNQHQQFVQRKLHQPGRREPLRSQHR